MAFFDELGKKIGVVAQVAAKKSGEIVEITKLSASISAEEEAMNKLYKQIGEFCFKQFSANQLVPDDILSLCEEISDRQVKLKELNDKLLEAKNVMKCPNCGKEVAKETIFCSQCGTKISHENDEAFSMQDKIAEDRTKDI